jgi:hypothetical protein
MVVTPLFANLAPTGAHDGAGVMANIMGAITEPCDPGTLLEAALHRSADAYGAVAVARIRAGPHAVFEAICGPIDAAQAALAAECLRGFDKTDTSPEAEPGNVVWVPVICAGENLGELALIFQETPTLDRDLLAAAATLAGLAVARAGVRKTLDHAAATSRKLELAATIQGSLLPKDDPVQSPVQGLNRPIRVVSGDFYDYFGGPTDASPLRSATCRARASKRP